MKFKNDDMYEIECDECFGIFYVYEDELKDIRVCPFCEKKIEVDIDDKKIFSKRYR